MDMTPEQVAAYDRMALTFRITDRMKGIAIDLVTLHMRIRDELYTQWALGQVEASNA